MFRFTTILLLLGCCSVVAAVREPATGIEFAPTRGHESLRQLGVRTKGPIKVYAVGLYGEGTFVLQMARAVGAEKMSSALADALQPRCSGACGAKDIQAFEELLLKGLPKGAPKKTKLTFETAGGKLTLAVNDKKIGKIKSKALATAFANIYTDSKAVCKLKPVLEGGEQPSGGGSVALFSVAASVAIVAITTIFLIQRKRTKAPDPEADEYMM